MIFSRPSIAQQLKYQADGKKLAEPVPKTWLFWLLEVATLRGPWCPTCDFGAVRPKQHMAGCVLHAE
jgi:hypothetical protein